MAAGSIHSWSSEKLRRNHAPRSGGGSYRCQRGYYEVLIFGTVSHCQRFEDDCRFLYRHIWVTSEKNNSKEVLLVSFFLAHFLKKILGTPPLSCSASATVVLNGETEAADCIQYEILVRNVNSKHAEIQLQQAITSAIAKWRYATFAYHIICQQIENVCRCLYSTSMMFS